MNSCSNYFWNSTIQRSWISTASSNSNYSHADLSLKSSNSAANSAACRSRPRDPSQSSSFPNCNPASDTSPSYENHWASPCHSSHPPKSDTAGHSKMKRMTSWPPADVRVLNAHSSRDCAGSGNRQTHRQSADIHTALPDHQTHQNHTLAEHTPPPAHQNLQTHPQTLHPDNTFLNHSRIPETKPESKPASGEKFSSWTLDAETREPFKRKILPHPPHPTTPCS
jgi:hypothetical protein